MKQHITKEQFGELSEEGQVRLRAWVNECRWVSVPLGKVYLDYYPMPLLSIGQMIEFLDEHRDELDQPWWKQFFTWDYGTVDGYDGEFCDALWEAVKQVLEKE